MSRWRDSLVHPYELTRLATDDLRVEATEALEHDLVALRGAVGKLASIERDVLISYVSNPHLSEKELARRFSMTRYRLRLCLADALGKLAVRLGNTDTLGQEERSVVLALWEDGRTARETARISQKSTSEVQAMRMRLFETLSRAVKGAGSVVLEAQEDRSLMDPEALLLSLAASGVSEQDLDMIRRNSDVILRFLDEPRAESFFRAHEDKFTAETLARLYTALGVDENFDSADRELLNSFFQATADDEAQVGHAFSSVLMPNLPTRLTQFQEIFRGAPMVDMPRYRRLMSEKSVTFGGQHAGDLATFGITPVTVVEATQAVANLSRRFCDDRGIKRHGHFIMDRAERTKGYSSDVVLPRGSSVEEISLTCELPRPTGERLCDWLTGVAQYTPFLYDGFEAEPTADELWIRRTDETLSDLYGRWWKPPPLALTG
jgi:hypothetical protein